MRYVKGKYAEYRNSMAYRIYMADSSYFQADGKRLNIRFLDYLKPKPVDNRTGDEIAAEIIAKLGLEVQK